MLVNTITELSKKLISIESVKEKYHGLIRTLDVAKSELKGLNYNEYLSSNSPSLLFYNSLKLPSKFRIILNAHLDVIEANPNQFKPFIKADKLFGRGAMDMKAASAVEILVFKELSDKLNYPIGLQLVTDEETGGFNGTKHQLEKGVKADFVVAGESTDMLINDKAKGIIWAKIISNGNTAHGAYPWNGINSNFWLTQTLSKIWEIYPIPKKEVWRTTINIGKILTNNEAFNRIPDYSEAWLDIRYIPGDKDLLVKNIRSCLNKYCSLEFIENEPVHNTTTNNPYVRVLKNSHLKIAGNNTRLISKHGASDIRHFNQAGIEGVCYGPVGEGLHSDKEWVSIKSLEQYYLILKDFLLSLN